MRFRLNTKTLNSLFLESPVLKGILEKADQLNKINAVVLTTLRKLGSPLANHCRVSNIRQNTLILTASTPTWGHQLRFTSQELLETLDKDPYFKQDLALRQIQKIEIEVFPQEWNTNFTNRTNDVIAKPKLTPGSAQSITEAARQVSFINKRLEEALLKLATRQ